MCDWGGWTLCDEEFQDHPPDVPFGLPPKDGRYLIRKQEYDGGDRMEKEGRYCSSSVECDLNGFYTVFTDPIKWGEHKSVYAWKPLP